MAFEHYIQKGSKKLRMGYTTGSCAALAAKAAAQMLLTDHPVDTVEIMTPKGLPVEVAVLETVITGGCVSCAVQKDAGDDPDVTDGSLVFAKVSKADEPGINIDGGEGIGRVTRPGLDQPIGAAAINHVPRQMISTAVQTVCDGLHYEGGMSVVISLPDGVRLARRTFNPKLGIEGGLSVLGTSGIVEPQSTQALIDCIGLELRALAALGYDSVVLTPGNYGESFLETQPFLKNAPTVKVSNFVGDALDFAVASDFKHILLVGHIGKFVKLAGGITNTHSSTADCRTELITAHAALAGVGRAAVTRLMNAVSTDACIEILDTHGMRNEALSSLLEKIQEHLQLRVGDGISIGAVLFSNVYGLLGQTAPALALIEHMKTEVK